VSSLGRPVLLVLSVVFAAATGVFALGLAFGLAEGDPLLIVPQVVLTVAFGAFTMRLWRLAGERRTGEHRG
jgi:hypothetical protein